MLKLENVSSSKKSSAEASRLVQEYRFDECMQELICDAFSLLESPVEMADLYETISRQPKVIDFDITLLLQKMFKSDQKFRVSADNKPKQLKWVEAHHLAKKFVYEFDEDELYSWANELLEIWDSSRLLRHDYPAFVYFMVTNPDPRSFDPAAAA